MDFENLTLDRLIDTGALTSAISEAYLYKIKLLSNKGSLFDIRQGIITFSYLSMQLPPEQTTNTRAATPLLTETTYTLQPGETLAISSKFST